MSSLKTRRYKAYIALYAYRMWLSFNFILKGVVGILTLGIVNFNPQGNFLLNQYQKMASSSKAGEKAANGLYRFTSLVRYLNTGTISGMVASQTGVINTIEDEIEEAKTPEEREAEKQAAISKSKVTIWKKDKEGKVVKTKEEEMADFLANIRKARPDMPQNPEDEETDEENGNHDKE